MGLFTKNWRDPYRRLSDGELLERIRTGDKLAEDYLWETYHLIVLAHMKIQFKGKPDYYGEPGDYAHDAILLLIDKARIAGAAVLKHTYSTIGGWLKQTGTHLLWATMRKDQFNDRDQLQNDGETEDEPKSIVDNLKDEGADSFADMSNRDYDQIVRDVLAKQPEKLDMLIRLKFMNSFSWKEVSELMMQLYPDNKPPFALAYLQQTYWDRVHKKPFINQLLNALK